MAGTKGADLIAEFLVREKIPYVFGICGHGTVGMLDGLYGVRDKIRLISPRHEQVAGHMADVDLLGTDPYHTQDDNGGHYNCAAFTKRLMG